jgi:hypothetical protein
MGFAIFVFILGELLLLKAVSLANVCILVCVKSIHLRLCHRNAEVQTIPAAGTLSSSRDIIQQDWLTHSFFVCRAVC